MDRLQGTPHKLRPEELAVLHQLLDEKKPISEIARTLELSHQTEYTAKASRGVGA